MQDPLILDSRRSWIRLALALLIAVVGNAGMWAIILILPNIQGEFDASRAAASLPYSATMLGFALGNFLIGRAVDRFGLSLSLAAAGTVMGIGFAIAALVDSIAALTVVHLAIGFGSAASFGPLIADVSQWFLRRRGLAVAIAACGNYLAGALWPMALQPVLASGTWRDAYLVLAAICVLVMVPLTLSLRRPLPEAALAVSEAAAAARAKTTGLSPRALTALLAVAGIGCCVAMSMPQVQTGRAPCAGSV